MKRKVISVFVLVVVFILLFSTCKPINQIEPGTEPEPLREVKLTVSAEQRRSRSYPTLGRSIETIGKIDSEWYKENRKEENRGELLYTLTPESFILDLDNIMIYNKVGSAYQSVSLLKPVFGSNWMIVPQHYDLLHTNGIIRNSLVLNTIYDGLFIKFLSVGSGLKVGGELEQSPTPTATSNDGFYILAVVGIELPKEYNDVRLAGEIIGMEALPDGLRYFSFADLQPIETNDGFISFLTIGSDVEESWVQNPKGEEGTWTNPWGETTGNSVSLYLSSTSNIDLSSYENPKVIINWDMEDLIEIYDNGTPDNYADDIITFNLKNPFPISLLVEENRGQAGFPYDDVAPKDVTIAAIAGANTLNTLQWINPQDKDFKEVVITRKAGGKPTNRTDGEEVYRNHIPNFIDETGESGVHYYYLIQTVDYSGNYSNGVFLDQVQY